MVSLIAAIVVYLLIWLVLLDIDETCQEIFDEQVDPINTLDAICDAFRLAVLIVALTEIACAVACCVCTDLIVRFWCVDGCGATDSMCVLRDQVRHGTALTSQTPGSDAITPSGAFSHLTSSIRDTCASMTVHIVKILYFAVVQKKVRL